MRSAGARWRDYTLGYVLILPTVAAVLTFVVAPAYDVIRLSFTRFMMGMSRGYGGFVNYQALLADPLFYQVLKNTAIWTLVGTAGTVVLGLAIGHYLSTENRLAFVLRSAVLIPWILPDVVTASAWKWMLHGQIGVVNDLLERLRLIDGHVSWLGEPEMVMGTLVTVLIWRRVPLAALVFCAAIRAVPEELHEAARIDGAGPWQRFRFVVLPNIAFTITAVTVITLIWVTADFTLAWVMTRGGPANASHIMSTYIYQMAFEFFRWGSASAMAVINLALLGALVAAYLIVFRRTWGRSE